MAVSARTTGHLKLSCVRVLYIETAFDLGENNVAEELAG